MTKYNNYILFDLKKTKKNKLMCVLSIFFVGIQQLHTDLWGEESFTVFEVDVALAIEATPVFL